MTHVVFNITNIGILYILSYLSIICEMMHKLFVFFLGISISSARSASNLTLTWATELTFSLHLVLDRDERVPLSWLPDTQWVTLRQSVATHGYIGLEFSPGADIMLAWVDTGVHVHLTDRHAVGNTLRH